MADGSSPQKYKSTRPIDLYGDDSPRRAAKEKKEDHSVEEPRPQRRVENPSPVDLEIGAMKKIVDALKDLNHSERERVLKWAVSRFVV